MAYELAPLPYDYSALEPYIDAETMKLHHDKHHQTYINNVNAALEKYPELAAKSADDVIRDLNAVPEEIRGVVRNNGGGNSNHSAFWKLMGPAGTAGIGAGTGGSCESVSLASVVRRYRNPRNPEVLKMSTFSKSIKG